MKQLKLFTTVGKNRTFGGLKIDIPDEIGKFEDALNKYMREENLKILKTYSPDKRKFLTKKLTYSYEYFNTIDDYQKLGNHFQNEDIFRKLKK